MERCYSTGGDFGRAMGGASTPQRARVPDGARGTWDKGKGRDSFGPVGPWLVTTDEISDPQALDLWLDVSGQRMQQGNTRTMIFIAPRS